MNAQASIGYMAFMTNVKFQLFR